MKSRVVLVLLGTLLLFAVGCQSSAPAEAPKAMEAPASPPPPPPGGYPKQGDDS